MENFNQITKLTSKNFISFLVIILTFSSNSKIHFYSCIIIIVNLNENVMVDKKKLLFNFQLCLIKLKDKQF